MPLYRLTRPYLDEAANIHERNAILSFEEGKAPKTAVRLSDEDTKLLKKAVNDKKGEVLADFADPRIDLENVEGKALSELVPPAKK